MSLWAVYGVLVGGTALFGYLGVTGFKKRVTT